MQYAESGMLKIFQYLLSVDPGFPCKTSSTPQNSKTTEAITLNLGDFTQISISSIYNVMN